MDNKSAVELSYRYLCDGYFVSALEQFYIIREELLGRLSSLDRLDDYQIIQRTHSLYKVCSMVSPAFSLSNLCGHIAISECAFRTYSLVCLIDQAIKAQSLLISKGLTSRISEVKLIDWWESSTTLQDLATYVSQGYVTINDTILYSVLRSNVRSSTGIPTASVSFCVKKSAVMTRLDELHQYIEYAYLPDKVKEEDHTEIDRISTLPLSEQCLTLTNIDQYFMRV